MLKNIIKITTQQFNKDRRENIIILTLKKLGINVVELLAREQLYRQKKLPREISDIIESYLVENVRFVNVLKRNIFTEKKLSEEERGEIMKEIEELIITIKLTNSFKELDKIKSNGE